MENLKNEVKKMKAITLIALVITIIVLSILAGVAINISLENNGIFNRAKVAKEQYQNATNKEESNIDDYANLIDTLTIASRTSEEPIRLIATESNIQQYYGHFASSNGNETSNLKIMQIKNGFWIIRYSIPSADGYTPASGAYDVCDIDISSLGFSSKPQVLIGDNTNQFYYWGFPCYVGLGIAYFKDKDTLSIRFVPKQSECNVKYNDNHMYCSGIIPLIFQ